MLLIVVLHFQQVLYRFTAIFTNPKEIKFSVNQIQNNHSIVNMRICKQVMPWTIQSFFMCSGRALNSWICCVVFAVTHSADHIAEHILGELVSAFAFCRMHSE